MQDAAKKRLHQEAMFHVSSVIRDVRARQKEREERITRLKESTKSASSPNRLVDLKLLSIYQEEQEQLRELISSPYFARCDVQFTGEDVKTIYFAKFAFADQQIFSWTSPASAIRFESIGDCSYRLPDASIRHLKLDRKDQFMIVDGKILFMSTESKGEPRELIYQEYFAQHKTEFALPEIVAQMEKAQDQVIRAAPVGSMLISGPAGSGKTTLALHRIAFLAQSPDTAQRFPSERMIVFVQDRGTQVYFSQLLPSLGIHHVEITTFDQWTMKMLGLEGYTFVSRPGHTEGERDVYEYRKRQLLKAYKPNAERRAKNRNDIYKKLKELYAEMQDPLLENIFEEQLKTRALDRFDLTFLLIMRLQEGRLTKEVTQHEQLKSGSWRKRTFHDPIEYSLILLDEVQNYLPEQIHALKTCLDPETKALLYVGDLAQQTRLGTMRAWSEVGEVFQEERNVVLQKVYRNTKQILEYISRQGYRVTIPEGARAGNEVCERSCASVEEMKQILEDILQVHPEVSIGVLGHDPNALEAYRSFPFWSDRVRLLTIHEAQGVEFDVACLIQEKNMENVHEQLPMELTEERAHVARDLWYVALTRAMNDLYVIRRTA